MKTLFKILILIIFIFTVSCNENKNKLENKNNWYNNDFHLQMLFLPSFHSECFIELYNRNGKRILSMSPMIDDYLYNENKIKYSKSQCTISEIEFENFCEAIKNIDLKKIKSNYDNPLDGVEILCNFTSFSLDTNIFEFHSPDEESEYQRLSLALLTLCIDNFNFYPNAQAIEDIYHYFDKNLINRKRNLIPYYDKKYTGKYSKEFNDSLLKVKYFRLLSILLREGTPVPVPDAK
jgi:hypothetical protein